MKVLFDFSRSSSENNLPALSAIRKYILENNHQLTNDLLSERGDSDASLPNEVFTKINRAIAQSNCVVIEGSTPSISLGYILTEAINLEKPVLFLVNSQADPVKYRFIASIKSNLLTIATYDNNESLLKLLSDFFTKFPMIKKRFNLVIDNKIDSFLTKEGKERKVSKTELIISYIQEKMAGAKSPAS